VASGDGTSGRGGAVAPVDAGDEVGRRVGEVGAGERRHRAGDRRAFRGCECHAGSRQAVTLPHAGGAADRGLAAAVVEHADADAVVAFLGVGVRAGDGVARRGGVVRHRASGRGGIIAPVDGGGEVGRVIARDRVGKGRATQHATVGSALGTARRGVRAARQRPVADRRGAGDGGRATAVVHYLDAQVVRAGGGIAVRSGDGV